MKQNDRVMKTYFRDIYDLLPCSRKEKRRLIDTIKINMNTYLEEHPEATTNDIEQYFGTPAVIVTSYINSVDSKKLVKNLRLRKTIKRIVVTTAAVLMLLWGVVVSWAAVHEWKNTNGYRTTEIVEELN